MSNVAASHRLLLVGSPRERAGDRTTKRTGPVVRRLRLMQLASPQERAARFAHLRVAHD